MLQSHKTFRFHTLVSRFVFILLTILIFSPFITPKNVQSITFELDWDFPEELQSQISGYRVYYHKKGDPEDEAKNQEFRTPSVTNCSITILDSDPNYCFSVIAFDDSNNVSPKSNEDCYNPDFFNDNDPPSPDPMTWETTPHPTGSYSISMTATTALDLIGVEYYFECVSGGGHNSLWQSSPIFEDTGLQPDTQYTYRVKARDKSVNLNETGWSQSLSAFTDSMPPNITILGSWEFGTSHTKEPGFNRALIFTAHVEDNDMDMNLQSVTYGGQPMQKIIERNVLTDYRAYVVAYILDEAGIAAAVNNTFTPSWASNPYRTPEYSSVFLENVDQTSLFEGTSSNVTTTSSTLTTSALSTNPGDLVMLAGTCGNTGVYTVNNNFTKGIELSVDSADGITGYKLATGIAETPSITHSNVNRQVIIGFVIKAGVAISPGQIDPPEENILPIADNKSITADEDTSKAITLTATDADLDTLTYMVLTQPSHGTLSGSAPNLTYSPSSNYNGTDSFTFKVNDGHGDSNIATVSITISPVNDNPVASAQTFTTQEDTAINKTLSASDIDGDGLTYSIVANGTKGIATITNDLTGAFTYTPNKDINASDTFSFKVNDGKIDSSTATVTVNITPVNDAPVADSQSLATDENTTLSIILTGSDVDGDILTYTIVTQPSHGTLSGTAPTLTYTPDNNYSGSDSFSFKVYDGVTYSNTATVSITINPVEDFIMDCTIYEDSEDGNISGWTIYDDDPSGASIINVFDTDRQSRVIELIGESRDYCYLLQNPDGSKWNNSSQFIARWSMKYSRYFIVYININTTAGEKYLYYSPDDYNSLGVASYVHHGLGSNVMDGNWHSFERDLQADLEEAQPGVSILQINSFMVYGRGRVDDIILCNILSSDTNDPPPNSLPVADNKSITADEDTSKAITLTATDADLDPLTYTVLTQPSHGTLSGTAPNMTYSPSLNYFGSDSFTFKTNDGHGDSNIATVSITISPVNDNPVASAQTFTTQEDTAINKTLSASDIDGDGLTYSIVANGTKGIATITNASTGVFTYTPNKDMNGTDTFRFKVNDGKIDSSTATVTVSITPVNDVPVAVSQSLNTDENTALTITLTASDVDGDSLTYTIVTQPSHGTLSGTAPNLTYTPNNNYSGSDSFTFKVYDSVAYSNTATISINIALVNSLPIADNKSITADEDTSKAITLTATDADLDPLTYTVLTQPSHGTLSGTAPNLTYSPSSNYNGTDSFTFKVNDGQGDSNIATVSITISPVNDNPVASAQTFTTQEDTAINKALSASDIDEDGLTYFIVANGTKGIATITNATTGAFTYTPNKDINGSDTFSFKVNDGKIDSSTATVTVNITPMNDAPVAVSQSRNTNENTALTITLTASDVDGDSLTYTIVTQPSHGTLSGTAPNLTYTPDNNYSGSDSFSFKVYDGVAYSNTATISINIALVNSLPIADNKSITADEDTSKAITLTATDADLDTLTYMLLTQPSHGTLSGSAPNLTYSPSSNYNGSDSFTFKVNDGHGDSNIATVSITISPVNDNPVASAQTFTTQEDTAINKTLSASDIDGDGLTYSIVANGTKGIATITNATTGAFTYTPNKDINGSDTFSFKVNDGKIDSSTATVTVNITPVNDAPVAVSQSLATDENTTLSIILTGSDVDSDILTYTIVTQPSHGKLSGTTPDLTYTPDTNYVGSDGFSFKIDDGIANSNTASVSITIYPVDDPQVNCTMYEDAEDGEITGWTIYDQDPSDAWILNIFDPDRQSQVIELGSVNREYCYLFLNENGSKLKNTSQFMARWSMKYSGNFGVYFNVHTTTGNKYIYYTPIDFNTLGTGNYVHHGIGSNMTDGQWHSFERDLQADLTEAQPGEIIFYINNFMICGSGLVDDIELCDTNQN